MSIKGLDTFFDVLALVKDPEKYEKKLVELKEETNKYQVVVESVVELSKVNDYTSSIKQREEDTKKLLENARVQATELTSQATAKANTIREKAQKVLEKAEEQARLADAKMTTVVKMEEEASKKAHELSVAAEELLKKEISLLEKHKELDERLAKLKSVMQV